MGDHPNLGMFCVLGFVDGANVLEHQGWRMVADVLEKRHRD